MNIIHWVVSAAAILIAAYLIPGVTVTLVGALVLAVVLALINVFLKPVITLLTLPINIVTLGLFSLVVNALLIMLAGDDRPRFRGRRILAGVLLRHRGLAHHRALRRPRQKIGRIPKASYALLRGPLGVLRRISQYACRPLSPAPRI